MSAIYGAIRFDGCEISDDIKTTLRRAYDDCVIDKFSEINAPGVFMGCGIQYFTPEAKHEMLPYSEDSIFFTADVVLDNRDELISGLSLDQSKNSPIADGTILFNYYKKYGNSAVNNLRGCFAFASYNVSEKEFNIAIDEASNRTVYFWHSHDMVIFSTLLNPIVDIVNPKLNDRWIADFLAMDHLFMINEPWECPYEDIYCVAPAHIVTITPNSATRNKYWEPTIPSKYILKDDNKYKEEFLDIFFASVRDSLRGTSPFSILLSAGYDSTAVAAVASQLLKSKNERLLAYTSIPEKGYTSTESAFHFDDESDLVKKTAAYYGNIDTHFISLERQNAWDNRYAERKGIELPYKSPQNLLWISEAMRLAYSQGSRIMLTGSFGNTTISYTDFQLYMNTLYHNHNYKKMFKELKTFSKIKGFNKKYAYKQIKQASHIKNIESDWSSLFGKALVRPSIIASTEARKRMISLNEHFSRATTDYRYARSLVTQDIALRQIGEIGTKHSLMTGVLLRDPTLDVRVLSFCAAAPQEIFCHDGEERRLVSVYLKEFMPEHILSYPKKGVQSSDYIYKLSQNWTAIREEWIKRLQAGMDSQYVDPRTALKKLKTSPDISGYRQFELTRIIYSLFILELEDSYNRRNPQEPSAVVSTTSNPLISIIVPVYNISKYIKDCLDSIQNQTYTNLEVIVIDDGSTDGSSEICDQYASDPRFKVIHQNNSGVSETRNAGLKMATGEFIGFVDGDDKIAPEMYETLIKLCLDNNVDIAVCSFWVWYNDGKMLNNSDGTTHILYNEESMHTLITAHGGSVLTPAVWNKLFRRKCLAGIDFPAIRMYEDQAFMCRVLSNNIHRVLVYNNPLYYYRQREGSLTKNEGSLQDLRDFVVSQQITLECINKLPQLPPDVLQKHQEIKFLCMVDLYCKQKPYNIVYASIVKHQVYPLRKTALKQLLKRTDIPRSDRYLLRIPGYSLLAYRILNRCDQFRRKIKYKLQSRK